MYLLKYYTLVKLKMLLMGPSSTPQSQNSFYQTNIYLSGGIVFYCEIVTIDLKYTRVFETLSHLTFLHIRNDD